MQPGLHDNPSAGPAGAWLRLLISAPPASGPLILKLARIDERRRDTLTDGRDSSSAPLGEAMVRRCGTVGHYLSGA